MQIGIDASRYRATDATGVEWYSYHIINALIDKVLNLDTNTDNFILYSPSHLKLEKKTAELIESKPDRILQKVLKAKRLWTIWRLSREMAKHPPQILFVPSHVLPLTRPKHSIITIHDLAFKYLKNSYTFFQYRYLEWSTKYAVKHATKIITPSNSTLEDLVLFYKCPRDKIVVIPHGFTAPKISRKKVLDDPFDNFEIFKYFKINKDTKYLLFIGRLESKKNLERLIKAFEKFENVHPEYKLILAGKRGLGFDKIMQLVNELQLNEKIIMPGYINESEKDVLYKHCQAFVFPSLYEGFGMPVLEAFYYKKPVLTSQTSSLQEVAKDAAHYCDPYDIESIELGLHKITGDEQYAKNLVSLGTKRLEDFSWSDTATRTLLALKEVNL